MHKRLLTFALSISLLLLSGCSFFLPLEMEQTEANRIDPKKYIEEFQDKWQYRTLTDDGKELYGMLYTAVKDAEEQNATVSYTNEQGKKEQHPGVRITFPDTVLTAEQFSALFESFFRDNPQFFYVSRTYHLEGQSIKTESEPYYDTLLIEFSLPLNQRTDAIRQLEATVASLINGCPTTDDDYEKELYLHDRLIERCVYDKAALNDTSTESDSVYTAYGALVEGKAVCEGYAKAMQLLLTQVRISATVVTGHSLDTNEAHMWNLVRINGSDYYLDPTWNDNENCVQHTYFNLTTEMLLSSHQLDPNQSAVTLCTATEENYFFKIGAYIDTYDRQEIARVVAKQLRTGSQVVQMKFAPGKYTNGQLFLRNRSLLEKAVNAYLADTNLSLWDYQLWSEEEQLVLTLVKKS
ncbi:MAG: hypothetical protein E7527_01090 [Ruminococcaceae bacterium]|nr:hypothetical protein [Oscillospiraceae bacterium]